jgi:hypothetical protein
MGAGIGKGARRHQLNEKTSLGFPILTPFGLKTEDENGRYFPEMNQFLGGEVAKFVRLAGALLLVSAGAVACTPSTSAAPVYCGGAKATIVVGATSPYLVTGTARNDVIAVTSGAHEVLGEAGNDTMCADGAGSTLLGGDGNDRLLGWAGRDRLDGGNGNDVLQGGGGPDQLIGGQGTDTVTYADHASDVTAAPDGKSDSGSVGEDDTVDPSVENLTGGSGNDTLTGSAAGNVIAGGAGADRLLGGGGNDVLEGGAGNDALVGMSGKDVKEGGAGSNFCDTDPTDPAAAACRYDPHTPTVQSITVTTPQINFRGDLRDAAYQIHATDVGGGVWSVNVGLCGPDGKADGTTASPMMLDSGTFASGTWQGDQLLPDDAPSGTWSICTVQLLDLDANFITYSTHPAAGSGARPMPAGNTFVVANDGDDHSAPVISNITMTPSVNVTTQDATVTVDFTVLDHGDGLRQVDVDLRHMGPSSTQTHTVTTFPGFWDSGNPELVTPDPNGDSGSGHYRATIVMPVGSAAGSWFANIRAIDQAYNTTVPYATMNVIDARPFTDVPRLTGGQVTTGGTPGNKTFQFQVASAHAEVDNIAVNVRYPAGDGTGFDPNFVSGTTTNGVWQVTLNLPTEEIGTYSITDISIEDRFGIWHNVPAGDLAKVSGRTWTIS